MVADFSGSGVVPSSPLNRQPEQSSQMKQRLLPQRMYHLKYSLPVSREGRFESYLVVEFGSKKTSINNLYASVTTA